MKYRREIDGLRAFAIIPVILFHMHEHLMPGGYLGVDLFFVISGFLITTILVGEIEAGEFSIVGFYDRRIRRILPAVTAMVFLTLLVSPLFMFSWEVRDLARSAMATFEFVANIHFHNQINYFEQNATWFPLLHMWSLSVEEQYYIVFPLLLFVISKMRLGRPGLFFVTLAITLFSFHASNAIAFSDPQRAFYLSQYRAWELGIGGLTAILTHGDRRLGGMAGRLATMFGLFLIVSSCLVVSPDHLSPFWKLPVVLGTAAILASRIDRGLGWRILTARGLRWIGLTSFSLYLFHQPVIAFAKLSVGHISLSLGCLLLPVIFALAAASYYLVEKPFRKKVENRWRVLTYGIVVILAGMSLTYWASRDATPQHLTSFANRDLDVSNQARGDFVRGQYNALETKGFTSPGKLHVLLIGDSFSQDLYNMFRETHAFPDAEFVTHYIRADCQPYFGPENVTRFIIPRSRQSCLTGKHTRRTDVPGSLLRDADVVFLASNWQTWSAARIDTIYHHFKDRTSAPLVVIGSKHIGHEETLNLHPLSRIPANDRESLQLQMQPYFKETHRLLEKHASNFPFIDIEALFCNMKKQTCPAFTPTGHLISFDGRHLTKDGDRFIGNLLLKNSVLSNIRREENRLIQSRLQRTGNRK